ncbi:hypothetical protein TIFTF001_002645 [Ficus carica]|uniref:Uncharacterized protein n=1 Tax=Ficus carica TaxID=3494 RepID=A0AA88CU43_FICCA|nr:hypothetical protein TIFTF001_002645 [Ficus carica]
MGGGRARRCGPKMVFDGGLRVRDGCVRRGDGLRVRGRCERRGSGLQTRNGRLRCTATAGSELAAVGFQICRLVCLFAWIFVGDRVILQVMGRIVERLGSWRLAVGRPLAIVGAGGLTGVPSVFGVSKWVGPLRSSRRRVKSQFADGLGRASGLDGAVVPPAPPAPRLRRCLVAPPIGDSHLRR